MRARNVAWLVPLLLAVSLTSATPAQATAKKHYTVKQLIAQVEGYHIVDRAKGAELTITGFTHIVEHKWGSRWYPTVEVDRTCVATGTCSPNRATANAAARHPRFRLTPHGWISLNRSTGSRQARSWYSWAEFWHWNWSKIWKWTWSHIFNRCIKGVAGGMGTLETRNIAVKLITRGGSIISRAGGPDGLAVAAVAGCMFNVFFSPWS